MDGCRMSVDEVTQAVGGARVGGQELIAGVHTDSRKSLSGALFVALVGPRFDGHDFVKEAQGAGAAALLVQRVVDSPLPQVVVADTRVALGCLAAAWRRRFDIPVIAVTGSNGKTTVKEMLAAILSQRGPLLATQGNLNNDIGLPLTLLRLEAKHCAAVIEEGANHPGEIAYLTGIAQPRVAVVTHAGAAHLAGFGSLEGVARAKGEIFSGLPADGVAVINADDPHAALWRSLAGSRRVVSFGIEHAADVRGVWSEGPAGGGCLDMTTPAGSVSVQLALLGRHNAMNALAATAAALAVTAPLGAIKAGLEALHAVPGRLESKPGINGAVVIDDTYNANPYSLRAALAVLGARAGRRFVALGDMGELGEDTDMYHRAAGVAAREHGVEHLYAVGEHSRQAVEAFGMGGEFFKAHKDMIDRLKGELAGDVTLLVKGSRSARMEQIVKAVTVAGEG